MTSKHIQESLSAALTAPVSKGERTKMRIVEGAIESFANDGYDRSSYASIAAHADVARQLVQKYFPDKELLLQICVRSIRAAYQESVVREVRKATDAEGMLRAYIRASLNWVDESRSHCLVWIQFYHKAAIDKEWMRLNTEMVDMGTERIAALLELQKAKAPAAAPPPKGAAALIQAQITGAIVALGTEKRTAAAAAEMKAWTEDACLLMARGRA
jgi:AcrR family transcriptional regulator